MWRVKDEEIFDNVILFGIDVRYGASVDGG